MFNQYDVIAFVVCGVIVLVVFFVFWVALCMGKKGDDDIRKSWQNGLQEKGKWSEDAWEKDRKAREWAKQMLEKMKKEDEG